MTPLPALPLGHQPLLDQVEPPLVARGLNLNIRDLQTLLKNIPDPLILTNVDGEVLWHNPGAQSMFKRMQLGGNAIDIINAPEIADAFSKSLSASQPVELNIKLGGLKRRYLNIRFVAFSAPEAKSVDDLQVLWTIHDDTEQRQLDKTRTDFVAAASHELRTPLASLVGFVETLQGPAKNDEKAREQFLDIMAEQARRMTRLIDDLLSLSKIEMNEFTTPDEVMSLYGAAQTTLDALTVQAGEREITLNLEGDKAAQVIGDYDQISQVLGNLAENAIKYGHFGSSVLVRISAKSLNNPDMASVEVIDQSDGIAPKHVSRLTERFYRIDKARSREMGGTGLGLAIVKHIIARHGGKINISSVEGEGSCFEVLLPRA